MKNPEDAKRIHHAVVYKKGRAAATLTRHAGVGVVFSYLPAYLSSGGPAIASTLPVLDVPVTLGHGSVPAFFAGLLPEGERLAKLRWAVKTTITDEFSLLLAAGLNPVGDVQIVPAGEPLTKLPPLLAVTKTMGGIRFADFAAVPGPVDESSLAGFQDKVTASYVHDKDPSRAYILKFNDGSHARQVETEHLLLTKARKLGIPVAAARLVHDGAGQAALLVSRFDRSPAGPLAVEDGAQLLGLPPSRKYGVPTEAVAAAIVAPCPARLLAARNVFLQFLFGWLTGNGNLHAKNISVVQHAGGEWFVAPAYDLQCTLAAEIEQGLAAGVPGGIVTELTDGDPSRDPGMALPLGGSAGSRTALARNDWLRFGRTLHLPERLSAKCIDKALAASALTPAELPFGREVSAAVVRVLDTRRAAMAAQPRHNGVLLTN
ncbi:type II toxin-antitoxin system HipA family toxin [Arthrobacter sp. A2-55]|uniref:type II toxin-antitoxin system HipA family toxin n=1 Tax=Arthrobacter sp. A2-55 TaxID=2897337 RepID=UPI0021CD46EB|nr:HipA domain-containing protein [Arthrobacter sp. A2-55]MCU6480734.1 HipA domain-containing protein [Arthrobacter sp. A2-55]